MQDLYDESVSSAQSSLIEWQITTLNIAVFGTWSFQKQKFIKNFASLNNESESDDDFEFVSSLKPVPHSHSDNGNIVFWNMPETDWLKASKHEYLNQIQLNKYDLLLICQTEVELDSNDMWLANVIHSKGKQFFLIKLHTNEHCIFELNDQYMSLGELEYQIVEQIKDNLISQLDVEMQNKLYLISPHVEHRNKLDFDKLSIEIFNSLAEDKMKSLAFTMEPTTKNLIEKKLQLLKSSITHSAILSTLGGMFTHIMPGLGLIIDATVIIREVRFYLTQFGLNEESLVKTSKSSGVLYDDLLNLINKSSYATLILLKDMHALISVLTQILPMFGVKNSTEVIKFFPILGTIIHGSASFLMTKHALTNILDELANVALDINQFVEERKANAIIS